MNKAGRVFVMAICAFGMMSCGDDGERTPESIDGPAILRVSNETRYPQEVTFDGKYIGDVAGNSSRDWRVPAGTHTVNIHDTEADHYTMTGKLQSGVVTDVRFWLPAPGETGN